jgi:hypothetical protein
LFVVTVAAVSTAASTSVYRYHRRSKSSIPHGKRTQPPPLHLGNSFPPPKLERSYLFGCYHCYIPHTYRTCTLKRVKAFKLIYLADPKRSVTTTSGLSLPVKGCFYA